MLTEQNDNLDKSLKAASKIEESNQFIDQSLEEAKAKEIEDAMNFKLVWLFIHRLKYRNWKTSWLNKKLL